MDKLPHEAIKKWLIELGEEQSYQRSYSGDSEPIDIRVGKRHITYKPDVVWGDKNKLVIFEIAFTGDWRAIIGEAALCGIANKSNKVFIIVPEGDANDKKKIEDGLSMIKEKLDMQYKVRPVFIPSSSDSLPKIKKIIMDALKKDEWVQS